MTPLKLRQGEAVILLVEDNPDDEALTLIALRDCHIGNEVAVARDGEEALDYLFRRGAYRERSRGSDPQLVLLDLKLPKLDGLDVLRQMRQNPATKYIPVVILTTSSEERDLLSSYDVGANSYIRKPVDFTQFSNAVKQLSLYWLVLNERPRGLGP